MKVLLAGTFDILTVGHINLLLYSRSLAQDGLLYVCMDADEKVSLTKGLDRPIFNWSERAPQLDALRLNGNKVVDKIMMHTSNGYLKDLIQHIIKPDIIVVGSDYKDKEVIGSEFAEVKYFDRDFRFSSTKIIEACRRSAEQ